MILTIAVGFVCGVFLLAAILALAGATVVIFSKYRTIEKVRTRKKYDFKEEEDDEFDWNE